MSSFGKNSDLFQKKGILSFKSSLGRMMVFSLMLFTFIPVAILSSVLYVDGRDGIDEVIHNVVQDYAEKKSADVEQVFITTKSHLESFTQDRITNGMVALLIQRAPEQHDDFQQYVNSDVYRSATRDLRLQHSATINSTPFNNIFFINTEGRIMYAADETGFIGSDMINGKYASGTFDKTFFESLKTNDILLTDAFVFGPTQKQHLIMMKRVVQNETTVGVAALSIEMDVINKITADPSGMGETGEVFFLGEDMRLRSVSRFKDDSQIGRYKDQTPIVQTIINNEELHVIEYLDDEEVLIFSTYYEIPTIREMNLQWPLVLTIHANEIDTFSFRMRRHLLIIIICLFIFTILISTMYTDKLLHPILELTYWVKHISLGDLTLYKVKPVSKEFRMMADNISDVAKTFRDISGVAQAISVGDYSQSLKVRTEKDNLSKSINQMKIKLMDAAQTREKQSWIKDGQSGLNDIMRGDKEIDEMAKDIIAYITKYLDGKVGALYILNEETKRLDLTASYAFQKRKNISTSYALGEGIVGQCAKEQEVISISPVPEDYIRVSSGIGETIPKSVIVAPISFEDDLIGVLEIATLREFDDSTIEYMMQTLKSIGISLHSAESRAKVKALLEKTTAQADELRTQQEELKQTNEELQVQQEELRVANEELEEQTKALKKSEQELQAQQEELRVINEELEEKTKSLEHQKKDVLDKNMELEVARANIEQKAKELEISSKYKSEFLANMSHELRTPLNSLLILSRDLADNSKSNLEDEQVESAEIIYKSGNDLLVLINEILDLSKIESGKMSLNLDDIDLQDIVSNMNMQFRHVAEEKELYFKFDIDKDLPQRITTDQQRLEQVLKNMLSNAMKFTHKGGVTLRIDRPEKDIKLGRDDLTTENAVALSIVDTGIGIPKDKQLAIFEAFQQVDGSTSRKYGGTGLGLSISRELAKLLGGEIHLKSEEGKGSVFTIVIPQEIIIEDEELKEQVEVKRAENKARFQQQKTLAEQKQNISKSAEAIVKEEHVDDDRNNIEEGDRKLLIIEDDKNFGQILKKQSKEKGFKCLVALSGESGINLAREYMPDAIILDLKLPGIDGMDVLDVLKDDPKTRHIPVHMMSAYEETIDALKKGAIGYLMKPPKQDELEQVFNKLEHYIKRKMKDLLLVEDDENMRKSIKTVIGEDDVNITAVGSGKEAIKTLEEGHFDCLVLDLGLPDMTGFDLLKKLDEHNTVAVPPVIVYTGKELTREENETLQKYTNTIIIKGVKSEERLLDETALFLHRVVDNMPQKQKKMITNLHDKDSLFTDKNILVVDDDMRNVFALSKILTGKGMKVSKAVNGKMALELIKENNNFDLVLLDIMMPEMDGYETTRKLREMPKFRNLPVIALTAKAMKDDRQKCIDAGANDYLSKPVNVDKLLSLMRVWLYR